MPEQKTSEPLGIYVHWPFCEKKCPYCDFNSHVREQVDHVRWRDALLVELEQYAGATGPRPAVSLFFGGGTPSLMEPETVATTVERVKALWPSESPVEITLEANPSSVEAGRFRAYADAGVNRLSVGVQSLKDSELQFLGRLHDAKQARAALEVARNTFARVSTDFIYALPEQTLEDWRTALGEVLAFDLSHLSLYQLTIEEGTGFWSRHARGEFQMPDEALAETLFDLTQEMTEAAGLPAYEISNHAKPGQECRHNLVYWHGEEYVGVGPGAHGRICIEGNWRATSAVRRPERWLEQMRTEGHGREAQEEISINHRAEEMIMMGLRLREGVTRRVFEARIGRPIESYLNAGKLGDVIEAGLIADDSDKIAATATGRKVLNTLLAQILD